MAEKKQPIDLKLALPSPNVPKNQRQKSLMSYQNNSTAFSSTAKNGASQTFLNLGFHEAQGKFTKGVRTGGNSMMKVDSRSTRYSKPFEEPSTALSRPNGHAYSETVAKYLGSQPAGATKAFNTIQSGAALTKSPVNPVGKGRVLLNT